MAEPVGDTVLDPSARRRLVRLAYRLLGSVEEAEDTVQDAHLKLLSGRHRPDDPYAYLFRTVTNLAIDRLRHLKIRRRAYHGPWLPEPLVTGPEDAETAVARSDDLGVAFLLLLERLSESERVAFVLREVCELSFQQMAELLDVRDDACRQRYHRARSKLAGAQLPENAAPVTRRLLERLSEAVSAGDARRLAGMLTEDALLLTDGGGRVGAAIRPVESPARIAQVLVHLARREHLRSYAVRELELNGGPALLISVPDAGGRHDPYATVQVDVDGDRVSRIYVVRNPDKLTRLPRPGTPSTE